MHIPGPPALAASSVVMATPSLAPSLLPGNGELAAWPSLSLWEGQTQGLGGRLRMTHRLSQEYAPPSQGWVLRDSSDLILSPSPQRRWCASPPGGRCMPRPCSVTFLIM